jgi:REP element-mobilizing transposase RayT
MIVFHNANRYDIGIAGWALMPNHPHLGVFDRNPYRPSRVPMFRRQVHAQLAKFLKNHWGIRIEQVFGADCVSQLFPIIDDVRVISTLGYIMANPVQAGIVARAEDMPRGAVSLPSMIDQPFEIERPDEWFSSRTWPETITVRMEVPPTANCKPSEWRSMLEKELITREKAIAESRAEEGLPLLGIDRTRDLDPYQPVEKRENRKHTLFAGSCPSLLARLYLSNRRFLRAYRAACLCIKDGRRDVVFPFGTGKMCATYGFRMHLPPG